jgi:hypothetical protein
MPSAPATDVHLPGLRSMARHAAPGLGESSVAPLLLSTLTMRAAGVVAGLVAGMIWTGLAIFRRRMLGRAIPGLMALGALTGVARIGVALALRNPALVLIQPLVTTAATGIAFCATARGDRPMPMRLAGDFVPLPDDLRDAPWVRRFFARIAVLWGVNILLQVAVSAVMLGSMDTATYLVARAVVGWVLTGAGVGVSVAWFRAAARRHGVKVVLSTPVPAAAGAA